MAQHPIESIMTTTLENIRDMIDVNTIIGEAITARDGSTIIPLSRVSFGFIAGGGEYSAGLCKKPAPAAQPAQQSAECEELPFGGGTGAGVTLQPMGFLVVSEDNIRMIPAHFGAPIDRIIEMLPQVIGDIKRACCNKDKAPQVPCEPPMPL